MNLEPIFLTCHPPSPLLQFMEQSMRSMQKSCALPVEFFEKHEPMIGMKFRQKGKTETQNEFLQIERSYLMSSEVGDEPLPASKMVIGIDWARDVTDQSIAAKLREWVLKKNRARGMEILARAAMRGESEGWGRPVIINPARPELVMLPELPELPAWADVTSYCSRTTHVLLDESLRQWFRRPRSKKKRIREKWRKRAENWRPSPLLYGVHLFFGKQAMRFGYGRVSETPASGAPLRTWLMHPDTWARLEREQPELAATCSVNRRSDMMMKKF